jgi:hypothetical protein
LLAAKLREQGYYYNGLNTEVVRGKRSTGHLSRYKAEKLNSKRHPPSSNRDKIALFMRQFSLINTSEQTHREVLFQGGDPMDRDRNYAHRTTRNCLVR